MTCQEFIDFLMAFLDGELRGERRQVFETHLHACPPCLSYMETYKRTIELEQTLCEHPDDPVPEDVPEELVTAIVAARQAERG